LLYDANVVPVGKDQLQHLEMTRDIAGSFNHQVGETLVVPDAKVQEETMYIPGTDGQKMSKSYGNFIDIFQTDKKLRKNVMKIITDSKGVEDPKNPDECNVFNIYKTMANKEQTADMRQKYEAGGFGYGHAKQELYELMIDRFGEEREKYDQLMSNPVEIEDQLALGAAKARKVAQTTISKVREKLGY